MGKIKESKEKIRGAVVALVTPTTPDYEVDLSKFKENVRFSIDGVKGDLGCLMAAGGGGEGYFLNMEQCKKQPTPGASLGLREDVGGNFCWGDKGQSSYDGRSLRT